MSIRTSILEDLQQALPHLRPQLYFKSSLTALSHAMEDQVLAGNGEDCPLVIASFQRERFYRQEAHRYQRIAQLTPQVYVLAAPESDFTSRSDRYETIAFEPDDQLTNEWHLIAIARNYATCLVCRERVAPTKDTMLLEGSEIDLDPSRRFEGIWTFERQVTYKAADLLLARIAIYRPELSDKIAQVRATYGIGATEPDTAADPPPSGFQNLDPGPFAQRLVTYLQVGQYKLLKAYRSISAQERKERLVNSITAAIRGSLDPDQILKITTEELGQALQACRCTIYRCKANDDTTTVQHEFLNRDVTPMEGKTWSLQDNPLFQTVVERQERIFIADTRPPKKRRQKTAGKTKPTKTESEPFEEILNDTSFQKLVKQWNIGAWLMVPVLYRGQLMGMVELHHCGDTPHQWEDDELALVDAIATQVGVALIQAETYANLEDLNQQLEALERTRSNLIAITGHELRTPLSTIQVCLESLASEPDMPPDLRQVMLNTALADAERLRELVQDFLTLSRFESGRVEWHPEPLSLQECVDLALSSIHARRCEDDLPEISTKIPAKLPLVQADGEWLVHVLGKLLDNACKFTPVEGKVTIEAKRRDEQMLEVTVSDTGRGIEPDRLEIIFDRFYQAEGALRRTTSGTGLGLAICRQIITRLGGQIWAESPGKDSGSQFHFTIPIVDGNGRKSAQSSSRQNRSKSASRQHRATFR